MSNALALPDSAPSYLAALLANDPTIMAANDAALSGMSVGMHPMISINGTSFFTKKAGVTEQIKFPATMPDGQPHPAANMPIPVLGCVILDAKGPVEKKCYLSAYNPDSADAPDCQSADGITPDAGVPNKQAESCAGCWANVFGSGTNQDGTPSKGKKCADLKKLALFAAGEVYGFTVPPGSLKNFTAYVRDLSARNIPLFAVSTRIGFDKDVPQILTFEYAGMLAENQLAAVMGLRQSDEVKAVIEFKMAGQKALPAPAQPAAPQLAAPATPAPAQPAKPAAPPKSNRAPKTAPAAAAPAAQPEVQMDLGMDLGLGAPAEPAPAQTLTQPAATAGDGMDDASLAAALGLPM